jgi:cystathionine gamma-synthase
MHADTSLVLAGQQVDRCYNSIVPPVYQSAIFRFDDVDLPPEFDYTRSGNPTRNALETTLADLEGGAGAAALSTGMAAITTVLSLLDADAHLICSHDCYGGTERLLCRLQDQGKLEVSFVDLTSPGALEAAVRPETRAIWVETPSNPLLRVTDLAAVADVAEVHDLLFVVDNTFLSPLLQQPFEHGADLVVYSTTKYINGHSDVVGGAVIAKTETLAEEIQCAANTLGTTAAPFDSWLVLRGLKTLPLRLRQHEENAHAVVHALEAHPQVERVFYPGLPSHPSHDVAVHQQRGFGGMVSFALRGDGSDVKRVLRSTDVFTLAESLGGVESLIEHPATMSHASMRPAQRAAAGITENVIRLSVGVERTEDLVADLEQALDTVLDEVAEAVPA